MRFIIIALFLVCVLIVVAEASGPLGSANTVAQGSKDTVGKVNNLPENVKQILANSGTFLRRVDAYD